MSILLFGGWLWPIKSNQTEMNERMAEWWLNRWMDGQCMHSKLSKRIRFVCHSTNEMQTKQPICLANMHSKHHLVCERSNGLDTAQLKHCFSNTVS